MTFKEINDQNKDLCQIWMFLRSLSICKLSCLIWNINVRACSIRCWNELAIFSYFLFYKSWYYFFWSTLILLRQTMHNNNGLLSIKIFYYLKYIENVLKKFHCYKLKRSIIKQNLSLLFRRFYGQLTTDGKKNF